MNKNITRREFTTKGADPTVIVEYQIRGEGDYEGYLLKIVEFQTVINTLLRKKDGTVIGIHEMIGKMLFKSLEKEHDKELEQQWGREDQREKIEISAAERKAGWDPNP